MDEPRIDLLDRLDDELVRVAREHAASARRRAARRRRLLVAGTAAAALAVAGTATAALTSTVTGVPIVDRFVDRQAAIHDQLPRAVDRPGDGMPPFRLPDMRAVPGSASPPIELPAADGGATATSLAYLTPDGSLTAVTVAPGRRADEPIGGGGGLHPLPQLLATLAADGVAPSGMSGAPSGLRFAGYAAADVTKVELLGPDGPVVARLTAPWRPDPEQDELRYFVAVVRDVAWARAIAAMGPGDRLPLPPRYPFRATYADGRVAEVTGPGGAAADG